MYDTSSTDNIKTSNNKKSKNRLLALLLAMSPFGFFGADRFYLGCNKSALVKAFTFGGLGLWWFMDVFLLLIDAFLYSLGKEKAFRQDANGNELKYGLSMYRFSKGKLQKDWFNK